MADKVQPTENIMGVSALFTTKQKAEQQTNAYPDGATRKGNRHD